MLDKEFNDIIKQDLKTDFYIDIFKNKSLKNSTKINSKNIKQQKKVYFKIKKVKHLGKKNKEVNQNYLIKTSNNFTDQSKIDEIKYLNNNLLKNHKKDNFILYKEESIQHQFMDFHFPIKYKNASNTLSKELKLKNNCKSISNSNTSCSTLHNSIQFNKIDINNTLSKQYEDYLNLYCLNNQDINNIYNNSEFKESDKTNYSK